MEAVVKAEVVKSVAAKLKIDLLRSGGGTGGSNRHNELLNRDLPNQHPIAAISGLEERLTTIEETKQNNINEITLNDVIAIFQ